MQILILRHCNIFSLESEYERKLIMNLSQSNFMDFIDKLDDKNYLLSTIVYSAAPVLGKLKPSYLLIFHNKGKRKLYDLWAKYKWSIMDELKIKFYHMKTFKDSEAVLFYNEEQLEKLLKAEKNLYFLKRYGYSNNMSIDEYLNHLKNRYEKLCPHEMGIFLGYPLEDVDEFIKYPNKKALMFGYWKVYSHLEEAKSIFYKYDEIKNEVMELIRRGIKPDRIINTIRIRS